jgi:hypothetical protein
MIVDRVYGGLETFAWLSYGIRIGSAQTSAIAPPRLHDHVFLRLDPRDCDCERSVICQGKPDTHELLCFVFTN